MNLFHADYAIDPQRWSKLASYNDRFMSEQQVKGQLAAELQAMKGAAK